MSKRHPLNTEFRWADLPVDDGRYCNAAQIGQFNSDGFCIFPQAVSPSKLQDILAVVDPVEQAGGASTLVGDGGAKLASYDADELTFSCNLVAKSDILAQFYRSELFVGITHDLIGGPSRLYWDQAVYKHPQKGGEFPWHQDNGYTFVQPQSYLTCWLALADAPVAAGCPWVIPGAHKQGTFTHVQQDYGLEINHVEKLVDEFGEVAAPVRAGDMVVFSSLTPHKTGPNRTENIRKALIIQFIPEGALRKDQTGDVTLDDPVLNLRV